MTEGGAPGRRNPPVLKRFGQHFLTDNVVLQSIADAIAPTAGDTVLEIGPGRGALTDLLIARAGRVVAVEIDRALAAQLTERYAGNDKVTIVQADVLETDFRSLVGDDYILVGNVPYYITTPIIFKSLEPPVSRRSVFLVQREVAERIAASANDSEYGALTVNAAATSRVEIIREVGSAARSPRHRELTRRSSGSHREKLRSSNANRFRRSAPSFRRRSDKGESRSSECFVLCAASPSKKCRRFSNAAVSILPRVRRRFHRRSSSSYSGQLPARNSRDWRARRKALPARSPC